MLDGGPSRVPQPIDRRAARRPEPPRRYPDEQSAEDKESRSASSYKPSKPRSDRPKSSKRIAKPLIAVLSVVILAVLGWLAWTNLTGGVSSAIDNSKNQAVFLQNGQTYFGKLEMIDSDYLRLKDVFYVQSDDSAASEDAEEPTSSSMQLIKRGEEVFGPEDGMVINRDQVMYFENIKDDSQVSQLMKDYKANN